MNLALVKQPKLNTVQKVKALLDSTKTEFRTTYRVVSDGSAVIVYIIKDIGPSISRILYRRRLSLITEDLQQFEAMASDIKLVNSKKGVITIG